MPALIVSALVWLFIAFVVIPIWGLVAAFWPLIVGLIVVLVLGTIFLPERGRKMPSHTPNEELTNPRDKKPTTLPNPERGRNLENWRSGAVPYNTCRKVGQSRSIPVIERTCNPGLEGGLSKDAAATIVALTRSASNARGKDAPMDGLPPKTSTGRKGADRQHAALTNNTTAYAPPGVPTRGLVIMEEPLTKILQGRKTMELRSKHNRQLGLIALIKKGSGKIYGVAEIVESIGPMSFDEFRAHASEHAVEPERLREIFDFGWNHGWRLRNVTPLTSPVSYIHKGMSQVKLDPQAMAALSRQLVDV